MDPETQQGAKDNVEVRSTNTAKLKDLQGEAEELLRRMQALTAQTTTDTPASTPKGFIELTNEDGEKLLVAVHTICVAESSGYQQPDSPARLLLSAANAVPGMNYRLKVQETYQQVLDLLRKV